MKRNSILTDLHGSLFLRKLKAILEKNKDYIERVEGTWISVEIPGVPFIQTYFRINKVTRTFITSGGCANLLLGLGEVGVKKIQLADHTYRLDMDKICLAQNPGVSGSFSWITKVVEYKKTLREIWIFLTLKGISSFASNLPNKSSQFPFVQPYF
jgi:hypothetical protein